MISTMRAGSPEPYYETDGVTSTAELRHGYTMQEVERLARVAVFTARANASYFPDRLDAAQFAIIETLYSSDEPPTPEDLLRVAWTAVNRSVSDERHHHGAAPGDEPGAVRPRFLKYWLHTVHAAPSPERVAVEGQALRQIWPHLTPAERRVLAALAEHEDYSAAAAALGLKYHSFAKQIRTGRLKFFALWHEGETPAGMWGQDRRFRQEWANPDRPRMSVTARHKATARDRVRQAAADMSGVPS